MTKSFAEIDSSDLFSQLDAKIQSEIKKCSKDYILSVDEVEYKSFLYEKYKIDRLNVDLASGQIKQPSKQVERRRNDWGHMFDCDVWHCSIAYSFTGSPDLLRMKPSRWHMCYSNISIDTRSNLVELIFTIDRLDPEYFQRQKEQHQNNAFSNIENANFDADHWVKALPSKITNWFDQEKSKYIKEDEFFRAINVKVDVRTETVFSVPAIAKKQIPQPPVAPKFELSTVPTISNEMYDDVLKVVFEFGKSMERKPSTYIGKDEEGIRDQFLLILETRYQSTSALGETFNRSGKTDILLKYAPDGSNLFVAECKFWHGEAEFLKAISQLFDLYLTWRDSKAALLMFVKNKDFSSVLSTINSAASKHPYFVKYQGKRGDSSFSYQFHLPGDDSKIVLFEIIAFHYDKQ